MNHITWSRYQQKHTNSLLLLLKDKAFYKSIYPIFLILFLHSFTVLFLSQNSLIYHKKHFSDKKLFSLNKNTKLLKSVKIDYGCFNIYILENKNFNQDILFLHGSKIKPEIHMKIANRLYAMGYNIIMPFYRGYGQSKGITNEINIMVDMLSLQCIMKERNKNFVIFGQSLGCAVAFYLNKICNYNGRKMVLENPFLNLRNLLAGMMWKKYLNFLLVDSWDNNKRIGEYRKKKRNKMMIMYGRKDQLVRYKNNGAVLVDINGVDNVCVRELEEANHFNSFKFEKYYEYIEELLNM